MSQKKPHANIVHIRIGKKITIKMLKRKKKGKPNYTHRPQWPSLEDTVKGFNERPQVIADTFNFLTKILQG